MNRWTALGKLVTRLTGKRPVSAGTRQLAELAGTARGYTTKIATQNNSKDQLLEYIGAKMEVANNLSGVDPALKNQILDEMMQGYMSVAAKDAKGFGGTGLHPNYGISKIEDVTGGDQGVGGVKTTRGGAADDGGGFDIDGDEGEWMSGDGDGY